MAFFTTFFGSSSEESDFEGFSGSDLPIYMNDKPTFRMVQSENDRENLVDVEYGWSHDDSPPTVAPFTSSLKKCFVVRLFSLEDANFVLNW